MEKKESFEDMKYFKLISAMIENLKELTKDKKLRDFINSFFDNTIYPQIRIYFTSNYYCFTLVEGNYWYWYDLSSRDKKTFPETRRKTTLEDVLKSIKG